DSNNQNRHDSNTQTATLLIPRHRRIRTILQTSQTPYFGLTPMILETSVQAQGLVPMAISLAFGILFATGITLLLVPSLYMILEDGRGRLGLPPSHAEHHALAAKES
ncbi:MAG: efflux RND transporter permease subunit, partial [Desulfuromonadales bacterium]